MPDLGLVLSDELLPLIFRRRRPVSPRIPIGNDLPEQGGIMGNTPRNILAAQDPAPPVVVPTGADASQVTAPTASRMRIATPTESPVVNAALREELTAVPKAMPRLEEELTAKPKPNVLSPKPVVSRSGQVMDEYSTRPARRVETDTRGRPSRNIALGGDEQTLDYANRVAKYEPQEGGGGWWPRIKAAIAGLAVGGPVGAASAFGTRMLREKFEPKLADQEWKRQQMGEVAPAVKSIRQGRKDALQEESTVANIGLAKARTKALKREKTTAGRIVERKDGVYMINPETGKAEKVAGIPPEAGAPGSTRYVSRPDGVYGINAEHPEGFKVKGIPGTQGKGEEDINFSNAQVYRAIRDAEAEQAKIDAALPGIPMTIEATDILTGTKKMVTNPEYTYNMTRRRQLDDDIRNWRLKLKAPKKKGANVSENDPLGILNDEDEP